MNYRDPLARLLILWMVSFAAFLSYLFMLVVGYQYEGSSMLLLMTQ